MKYLTKYDRQMKHLRSQQRKVVEYNRRITNVQNRINTYKGNLKKEDSEYRRSVLRKRMYHCESLIEHFQNKIERNS